MQNNNYFNFHFSIIKIAEIDYVMAFNYKIIFITHLKLKFKEANNSRPHKFINEISFSTLQLNFFLLFLLVLLTLFGIDPISMHKFIINKTNSFITKKPQIEQSKKKNEKVNCMECFLLIN